MSFYAMHQDCNLPVDIVIEARRDKANPDEVDAFVYVCTGHVQAARQRCFDQGLTPYAVECDSSDRCGTVTDLRN
ncbi:hypothetical protein [Streptomyces sp. NPDC056132]|uniref:hypothetical protein n=1 Tax=Streptomyces sp. NPDC056132 TaxID=3345722 RepID=UPI0035DB5C61